MSVTPKKQFFTKTEDALIVTCIRLAELNTSGEIKVHVESNCPYEDPFQRAMEVFKELGLSNTLQRNGVLFYLATDDRRFAVVPDEGINKKVPENFWDKIKLQMRSYFQAGNFVKGLTEAITQAGEQLKIHFPYQLDDENEISDDISKGD